MSSGESHTERLTRKAKDSPYMIVGLAGLVGLVGYGIYGFRTRKIKTSLYLIHFRVMAQGFVVGCLTVGAGMNLYNHYFGKEDEPKSIEGKN